MSTPPHSLGPPPPSTREDFFDSRDNFLFLLLGLIATAERVLSVAPNLLAPEQKAPPAGGHEIGDESQLLR